MVASFNYHNISLSIAMYYLLMSVLEQDYGPWYDSIFILSASICLFILLLRLFENSSHNQLLNTLATSVFGCYLIQYMFIYIFDRVAHGLGTDAWLQYVVIVGGQLLQVWLWY